MVSKFLPKSYMILHEKLSRYAACTCIEFCTTHMKKPIIDSVFTVYVQHEIKLNSQCILSNKQTNGGIINIKFMLRSS